MMQNNSIFDPHAAMAATTDHLRAKASFMLSKFHRALAGVPGSEPAVLDEAHAEPALRLNPVTWVEMAPDTESYRMCQFINGQKAVIFQSQKVEPMLDFMQRFFGAVASERHKLLTNTSAHIAENQALNLNWPKLAALAMALGWALVLIKMLMR